MDTAIITPPPGADAGWIPCRRCYGAKIVEFTRKDGTRDSGPCFLCRGTGDGRIRDYSGIGPRRGGRKGNGKYWNNGGNQQHGVLPAPTESESDSDDNNLPIPATPAQLTAAEHLAAALAVLGQSAPMDDHRVREILRDEFSGETESLGQLIADIQQQIADAALGIPRKLVIEWNGQEHELPAVRHYDSEKLFRLVKAGKRVYLVGPAGSGKTTACRQIADALGLRFYYQGAMSGSHCVLGHVMNGYHTTPTREAWEHGGLLLIDEIDGSEPDAALAIHPLIDPDMTFPDSATPIPRHPDFRLIVAANTYGRGADRLYVGRTQLDGATLNRFVFLDWGYDEDLERAIAGDTDWTRHVQKARKAVDKLKIRHVVSPRNSIDGNDLLSAGFDWGEVEDMALWQGLPEADIARVRSAMA